MSDLTLWRMTTLEITQKLEEVVDLAIRVAESSAEFRQEVVSLAIWWANVHPDPERLLSILFMHVQADLRNSTISADDLVERAKRAHAMRHSFDESTVAELVANAEARIARTRFLAHKHAWAKQEIAAMRRVFERTAQKPVLRLHDATIVALVVVVILFV